MKIAVLVILICGLIFAGFLTISFVSRADYTYDALGNPIYDFSVPIQDAADFFIEVGNFFKPVADEIRNVPLFTRLFVINYTYTAGTDTKSLRIVLYGDGTETNDQFTKIGKTHWMYKLYAYYGDDAFSSYLNNYSYFVQTSDSFSAGNLYNFSTMNWATDTVKAKTVFKWESSLMPIPQYNDIRNSFTPANITSTFVYEFDFNDLDFSDPEWHLIGA